MPCPGDAYRAGGGSTSDVFKGGLTSALFPLLAGSAFSIATTRHWSQHLRLSRTVVQPVGRFALFVVLGYGLHFPVLRFELAATTEAQWQSFLAVDVLQLIGVTLIARRCWFSSARKRPLFMVAAFVAATALIALSPAMWRSNGRC